MTKAEIFKELKKGVDFNTKKPNSCIVWDSVFDDDPYTVVSDRLMEWCELRGYVSNLIVKIKVGNDDYVIYSSWVPECWGFEFSWDWYEGEDIVQILAVKYLDDVFKED